MEFYKFQATGNDFILTFDDISKQLVPFYCNRYLGIGADGVINIKNQQIMIYNSDGSIAKMCGNGMRCVAKLLFMKNNQKEQDVFINHQRIHLILDDNDNVSVLMPSPIMVKYLNGYFVTLLNEHYILIVKDIDEVFFDEQLITLSNEKKCNIHFVSILNKKQVKIKTYEYGAKETKSCGSGSMAAFFILYMLGFVDNYAMIINPGGTLTCYCKNQQYYLKGNVKYVYKGEISDGI